MKTIEQQKPDGLDEYVKRINMAVNYKGNGDHEDVRSILQERDRIAREEVIREIYKELPPITAIKAEAITGGYGKGCEFAYECGAKTIQGIVVNALHVIAGRENLDSKSIFFTTPLEDKE